MDDIIFKVENQTLDSNDTQISTDDSIIENNIFEAGKIIVTSVLDFEENEYLQGVKINLYKINGLSPVLIESQITDEEGKVVFKGIENGCYRIIEIMDKRYFEKPKYRKWNEMIIDDSNKKQNIVVFNKIKKFITQDKHKYWI